MAAHGIDLVLAALDAALDRNKVALALLDVALVSGAAFVVVLVASLVGDAPTTLGLGVVWAAVAWAIHAVVGGAIARIAHVELALGARLPLGAAIGHALRHARSLVVVPGVIVLAAAGVVAAEAGALLVSRLPGAGDVAAAVLFLPAVVVNMTVLLCGVPALWLAPAVVAADGGGARASLAEVWATIRAAPGRVLVYLLATAGVAVVVGAALAGVLWLAIAQTLALAGWAGLEPARGGGFLPMLADLGLAGLGEAPAPLGTAIVPLLVYVLYAVLLVALVAGVPLYVFPICAACAARISVEAAVAEEQDRPPGA